MLHPGVCAIEGHQRADCLCPSIPLGWCPTSDRLLDKAWEISRPLKASACSFGLHEVGTYPPAALGKQGDPLANVWADDEIGSILSRSKHLLKQYAGDDQPLWVLVDGKARPFANHRTPAIGTHDRPRSDFLNPPFLFNHDSRHAPWLDIPHARPAANFCARSSGCLQEHLLHCRVVKGESREPLWRSRDQIARLPELGSCINTKPWGLVGARGA